MRVTHIIYITPTQQCIPIPRHFIFTRTTTVSRHSTPTSHMSSYQVAPISRNITLYRIQFLYYIASLPRTLHQHHTISRLVTRITPLSHPCYIHVNMMMCIHACHVASTSYPTTFISWHITSELSTSPPYHSHSLYLTRMSRHTISHIRFILHHTTCTRWCSYRLPRHTHIIHITPYQVKTSNWG